MPVTHIGIVYATGSKLHRRVIIPTADDSELLQDILQPGEAMLRVPVESAPDLPSWIAAIEAETGGTVPSGRAAMVNKSTSLVEQFCIADTALFAHPNYTIIQSDVAQTNWKWNGSAFLPRYVTVESGVVTAVSWGAASPAPAVGQTVMQNNTAKVGDPIVITSVKSTGTTQV